MTNIDEVTVKSLLLVEIFYVGRCLVPVWQHIDLYPVTL